MRSSARNSTSGDDEHQVVGEHAAVELDAETASLETSVVPGRSNSGTLEGAAVLAAGEP